MSWFAALCHKYCSYNDNCLPATGRRGRKPRVPSGPRGARNTTTRGPLESSSEAVRSRANKRSGRSHLALPPAKLLPL